MTPTQERSALRQRLEVSIRICHREPEGCPIVQGMVVAELKREMPQQVARLNWLDARQEDRRSANLEEIMNTQPAWLTTARPGWCSQRYQK